MDEYLYSKSKINEFILQDEQLLWTGKPVKKIKLLPAERFNIVFGIFWTAFSAFWIAMASWGTSQIEGGDAMTKIFPLFGVPFLLIGLYLVFVAPIRSKNRRKNLEYALTNKRILILYNGKTQNLQSFKYSEIQNVNFGCDELGVGVVTFSSLATTILNKGMNAKTRHFTNNVYGFYNINDVKKVYKIFCEQTGEKER